MRILYATQKTGNGHLARAQELIPRLRQHAQVDVLVSGSQSQFPLNETFQYDFPGISLFYSGSGGLDYRQLIFKNRWAHFYRTLKSLKLPDYHLIINDYEPITARLVQKLNIPIVGCSHQAALFFPGVPKPNHVSKISLEIIRHYAPVKESLGLHFYPWHPQLYPPIIRSRIKRLSPHAHGDYLAYLPAFSDDTLIRIFSQTPVSWCIFSKYATQVVHANNVTILPIDDAAFLSALEAAPGVLCQAGFELPAEALFLKKKLAVIPIKGQSEQAYNAEALKTLGIPVFYKLKAAQITDWIHNPRVSQIDFPDQTDRLVKHLLSFART